MVEPAVSASTVRRELDKEGYHHRKAKNAPYLRPATIVKRVRHARKFKAYTMREYGSVIYSDECYVHIGGNKGSIYVTRLPHERFHPDCTVPTFLQSSVRVMVWGCIVWDRKGPIIVLDYPGGRGGGMNSQRYRNQVLDGVLLEFYTQLASKRDGVQFLQDGAPCHTSKQLKKWFQDNDIRLFPHPLSYQRVTRQ